MATQYEISYVEYDCHLHPTYVTEMQHITVALCDLPLVYLWLGVVCCHPLVFQCLRCWNPLLGVSIQQFINKVFEEGWRVFVVGASLVVLTFFDDVLDCDGHELGLFEGELTNYHWVEHHPTGPYVAFLGGLALKHFRCSVLRLYDTQPTVPNAVVILSGFSVLVPKSASLTEEVESGYFSSKIFSGFTSPWRIPMEWQ